MKISVKLLGMMVAISGFSSLGWADQDGTSTAQFLKIGLGARAEGMGGAFTAVANDARAVNWNPAGLAQITRKELAFDHLDFIEDIRAESVAGVMPFNGANGSLGVGITYVDFGSIDKFDGTGNAAGTADVNAFSGVVSWGQALGDRFAIGVGAKFINQELAGEKGSGLAGDAGLLFFLIPDKMSLGVSALNFGQKIKTGTTKEDIPSTLQGGVAYYARPEWVMDADVVKENDSDAKFNVGTEYIYRSAFIVRVGYQDTQESKGGLSAGGGFIWKPYSSEAGQFLGVAPKSYKDRGLEIRFDYAYVDYGDFDATHRIGVNVGF